MIQYIASHCRTNFYMFILSLYDDNSRLRFNFKFAKPYSLMAMYCEQKTIVIKMKLLHSLYISTNGTINVLIESVLIAKECQNINENVNNVQIKIQSSKDVPEM